MRVVQIIKNSKIAKKIKNMITKEKKTRQRLEKEDSNWLFDREYDEYYTKK